jgi:hypothetical protein
MRLRSLLLALVLPAAATACGSGKHPAADAGVDIDAPGAVDAAVDAADDAAVDAAPGCAPTTLLTGGTDVGAQGWQVVMQPPATLSNGADYVELQTSTSSGARSGGQLLLHYPGAVMAGKPFKIQVVMLVEAVNPHNLLDSAAAILGSFTPPFGAGNDRNQMIYLDSGKIGWADDTQSLAVTVTDNAYHTYELSVDASGVAKVSVDGIQALTRNDFITNGAIAVGDQTNDPNVDSTLRIRSITRLCL